MDGPERIQGERVVLRRVVATDLPWLHAAAAEPATTNTRAIRCYEAVGFRPFGVARNTVTGH